MDPFTSLASSVVAVLAAYFAKAGGEFASETYRAAAGKIGVLYQALKTRFENQPTAKKALADFEAGPSDEDGQANLRRQLKNQMNADPTLIDTLRKLLDEIKQDEGSFSFLTQVYGGSLGNVVNFGLPGDSTTDAPPPSKR
ncbi:MAG TPA: hypothetical protein VJ044_07030 [Candidatus Hodarchaeales archaeon]|nr:hypothetical protein [Candidatus Hodarchaeales archaeon]